jgi:polyferredoxin
VRFDSLQGLTGGVKRLLRPRLYLYAALLVAGVTAASIAIASHEPFEANVLRMPGLPFALAEGPRGVSTVRNTYEIHLVNKQAEARTFVVAPVSPPGVAMSYALTAERITLASMSERRVPFVVTLPESAFRAGLDAVLDVTMEGAGRVTRRVRAPFAGPPR